MSGNIFNNNDLKQSLRKSRIENFRANARFAVAAANISIGVLFTTTGIREYVSNVKLLERAEQLNVELPKPIYKIHDFLDRMTTEEKCGWGAFALISGCFLYSSSNGKKRKNNSCDPE